MVKIGASVVLFLVAALSFSQDSNQESEGPVLFGDGGGRIWKWTAGEKTWLSPEGRNLVLGGVGEDSAWGWSLEGDRARLFSMELPTEEPTDGEESQLPELVFDPASFPIPDRADRLGDRVLLVYGARDGHPRYEAWQAGIRLASQAWDDGRTVFALALGPQEGWVIAGRTGDGQPWLEVSGLSVPVPEGWRGRLTVAAWVPEKDEGKDKKPSPQAQGAAPPELPVPTHPWAAGWGAPTGEAPRPLFWGPDGWTQPEPLADPETVVAGIYPVLGAAGDQGTLVLAGWQADAGTGALRPWFWNGKAAEVPGGTADGQPQAFSAGGKGGAFLVVRHQSAPWFTLDDGKTSAALEGLDADDRVVAVGPEASSSP